MQGQGVEEFTVHSSESAVEVGQSLGNKGVRPSRILQNSLDERLLSMVVSSMLSAADTPPDPILARVSKQRAYKSLSYTLLYQRYEITPVESDSYAKGGGWGYPVEISAKLFHAERFALPGGTEGCQKKASHREHRGSVSLERIAVWGTAGAAFIEAGGGIWQSRREIPRCARNDRSGR